MLIACPECAHSVSDLAVFCPNCGYPIKSPPKQEEAAKTANAKPSGKKKKKHKKLPNGYGSIKKLSGKRARPYAAYPPVKEYRKSGSAILQPAIGYYEDWYSAFDALRAYSANPYDTSLDKLTFADVFERYYQAKYENPKRTFSAASKASAKAAFKNCSALHGRKFKELRKADLQGVVDKCTLKYSSLQLIVTLYHGMYRYALENDMMDKDYSKYVVINKPDDNERGVPFTQSELDLLWERKDEDGVDTILILIYSGFRIRAYEDMEYNLTERYFRGGVKTKASRGRTVPIHDSIYPLVERYGGESILGGTAQAYRSKVFYPALDRLGIPRTEDGRKHTPHDCRHTFSWLCDRYGVDSLSKHMLMGHVLGGDVEANVYGHRTLDQLREEMAKIKVETRTRKPQATLQEIV